jgi:nicotinamidase/pyrazinamidase
MREKQFAPEKTAVIVVDIQADFTEEKSGSLAVPGTDRHYLEIVAKATSELQRHGFLIYFTQDWHPPNHISFYTNNPETEPLQVKEIDGHPQVMWPPHCVQNSSGAEILVSVQGPSKLVRKGMDPRYDSYSGFADNGGHKTELEGLLHQDGIKNLIVYGLATDYCVKASVMDALKAGYRVKLFIDLCRGVAADTTEQAVREMSAQGALIENFF